MTTGSDKASSIIQRGRRESGKTGTPMGYAAPDNRQVQGDREAPFFKVPPFPTVLFNDYFDGELPTDEIATLEPIAVAEYRALLLYVRATPGTNVDDQVLRIRMEVEEREDEWFPTAVIDGVLDISVPPSANRNVYPSELLVTLGDDGDDEIRVAIPYDVGFYQSVRFVIDLDEQEGSGAATVNLGYRLSL